MGVVNFLIKAEDHPDVFPAAQDRSLFSDKLQHEYCDYTDTCIQRGWEQSSFEWIR